MTRLVQKRNAARPVRGERRSSSPTGSDRTVPRGSISGRLSMIIGALLAVCAVSLATTGGTFALWNSTATVSVPSVQAGSLTITVNDAATANLDLSLTKLAPGVSLYAPVTVKNTGTLPVNLRVGATTASSSDGKNLQNSLKLNVVIVANAAACGSAVADATDALVGYTKASLSTNLAPAASVVACLRVKLDDAAPTTMQGGVAVFTVPIIGDQIP